MSILWHLKTLAIGLGVLSAFSAVGGALFYLMWNWGRYIFAAALVAFVLIIAYAAGLAYRAKWERLLHLLDMLNIK